MSKAISGKIALNSEQRQEYIFVAPAKWGEVNWGEAGSLMKLMLSLQLKIVINTQNVEA